jgi:hypothetical protein
MALRRTSPLPGIPAPIAPIRHGRFQASVSGPCLGDAHLGSVREGVAEFHLDGVDHVPGKHAARLRVARLSERGPARLPRRRFHCRSGPVASGALEIPDPRTDPRARSDGQDEVLEQRRAIADGPALRHYEPLGLERGVLRLKAGLRHLTQARAGPQEQDAPRREGHARENLAPPAPPPSRRPRAARASIRIHPLGQGLIPGRLTPQRAEP